MQALLDKMGEQINPGRAKELQKKLDADYINDTIKADENALKAMATEKAAKRIKALEVHKVLDLQIEAR